MKNINRINHRCHFSLRPTKTHDHFWAVAKKPYKKCGTRVCCCRSKISGPHAHKYKTIFMYHSLKCDSNDLEKPVEIYGFVWWWQRYQWSMKPNPFGIFYKSPNERTTRDRLRFFGIHTHTHTKELFNRGIEIILFHFIDFSRFGLALYVHQSLHFVVSTVQQINLYTLQKMVLSNRFVKS